MEQETGNTGSIQPNVVVWNKAATSEIVEKYIITPVSKKELAGLYSVSMKTLNAWLKPIISDIGLYLGRCFTVAQLEKIYKHLGTPNQSIND